MYRDRKGNYHKKPENILAKKRESAYGIFFKDSKVLLIKPSWINIWEFPGGGKDYNENLLEALKREFLKETGFEIIDFDAKPLQVINSKFYADDLDEYFDSEMNFFRVTRLGNQNKSIIDSNEIIDLKNISISELNEKNMNNIHLGILNIIKNGQN